MLLRATIIEAVSGAILCSVVVASVVGEKCRATSLADYRAATTLPGRATPASVMIGHMARSAYEDKVLYSVVGLVAVLMVDQLILHKRPPEVLAHNESMFSNVPDISGLQGIGMFRHEKIDISVIGHETPSLPPWIVCSSRLVSRNVASFAMLHAPQSRLARSKCLSTTASTSDSVHAFIIDDSVREKQEEVSCA